MPVVIYLEAEHIESIFQNDKPAIFLFREETEALAVWEITFAKAAKELQGQVLFVIADPRPDSVG